MADTGVTVDVAALHFVRDNTSKVERLLFQNNVPAATELMAQIKEKNTANEQVDIDEVPIKYRATLRKTRVRVQKLNDWLATTEQEPDDGDEN